MKKDRSAGSLPQRITAHRETIATWLIGIYAVGALLSLFSWILSPLHKGRGYTWWEYAFGLINVPVSHSLVSVIAMMIVTSLLVKRRRLGLYAVMFFQVGGILLTLPIAANLIFNDTSITLFTHSYRPLADLTSVAVALITLTLLFLIRPAFPARIARTHWRWVWLVAGLGLLVAVGLAFTFAAIQDSHHQGELTPLAAGYVLSGLGIRIPELMPTGYRPAIYFRLIVEIAFSLTLLATMITFLRSPRDRENWKPADEVRLREMLRTHGEDDSLGYFATRREKSVIFSDDGQAAVTYRVINSVCLASGNPIGAPGSWDSAIANWKNYARTYGWHLGAVSINEAGAKAFAAAGLSITYMGDEAVLSTDRFSLNNTTLTEVRQATRRLNAEGLTVRVRTHGSLNTEELAEVNREADSWRHGGTERGFSMALGRVGDPADGRNLLVTAHGPDGEMLGLLSFVPWGRRGVSLDLMRRSPKAPNGIVEFMVASLMEEAGEYNIARVSLNFAMFRKTFVEADHFGASPWTRASASTLGFFDRYLQLERLYRFNQKFDPEWLPRYLAAETLFTLPQVAVAAGVAEGFLPQLFPGRSTADRTLDEQSLAQVHELHRRVDTPVVEHRYTDQTKHRIRHLEQLREAGMNPYPQGVGAQYTTAQLARILEEPNSLAPSATLTVAGRVRNIRSYGSVVFLDLIEGAHTAQVVCERSALPTEGATLDLLRRTVDTGDILIFTGTVGASRNGTPSLLATGWQMASKSLHAIPFGNFTDPEARLRRRSTDLLVNPEQRQFLRQRTAIITSIRKTLDSSGFLEVETPILNTIHGGATARPFTTFINAYGADLYLRIAPELYLKRLVVGDMGPVYELGRDFRNEGADATHNPEFTVLEAYKPYADYNVMRELTEALIKNAAFSVFGSESLPLGEKNSETRTLQDVSGPWPVKTVCGALSEVLGREITLETDFEELLALAREHEIYVRDGMGAGAIIEELYGELVEAATVFPTFYIDFPVETSPLAGPHRSTPGLAERWDLVVNGMELGTAYSEMADALEQRRRLTEQSLKAAAGDLEAMEIDEDFLYALETGLPPTGGLGIGIDRLVMLMAGTQIRGVLTFPFVKPQR